MFTGSEEQEDESHYTLFQNLEKQPAIEGKRNYLMSIRNENERMRKINLVY